jgi:hypothetical protein
MDKMQFSRLFVTTMRVLADLGGPPRFKNRRIIYLFLAQKHGTPPKKE